MSLRIGSATLSLRFWYEAFLRSLEVAGASHPARVGLDDHPANGTGSAALSFCQRSPRQTFSPHATPIKHVIMIIGENRTFDHVYATYKPRHHQRISNLLSKGIVNPDGTPGWNYLHSAQYSAVNNDEYSLGPDGKRCIDPLPAPTTSYVSTTGSDTAPPPFATLAVAKASETDLEKKYNPLLLTGASGLPQFVPDTRIARRQQSAAEGVYQITRKLSYDSYTGDPVHRFYQMWQQFDCRPSNIHKGDPSGCSHDLFPYVETSIGTGSNGNPQPANFNNLSTGEGAMSMGFYNVQQGDAPYMKFLADHYNMSDNMHQSIMGGTGANHIMFGFADDIWYSDGKGKPYCSAGQPD